jgi:hypothetical protein
MFDLLERTQWDQIYGVLTAGDPPMAYRLLALNTLFFVLFLIRRMRGAPSMRKEVAIRVQGLLIAANSLLLFQEQVIWFLRRFI